MGVEKLLTAIKRGDTPLLSAVKNAAKAARRLEMPAIPGVYDALYWAHQTRLHTVRFAASAAYYKPMFRRRCTSCGQGLEISHSGQGMPWLVGDLDIRIGDRVTLYDRMAVIGLTVGHRPLLQVGNDTQISQPVAVFIGKRVSIGAGCLIGCSLIADNPGHRLDYKERLTSPVDPSVIGEVAIGDHVWAALQSMIIGDVTVGTGAVIAARAVVTKNVPPFCVVAGTPAKIVKKLPLPQELMATLGDAAVEAYRRAELGD